MEETYISDICFGQIGFLFTKHGIFIPLLLLLLLLLSLHLFHNKMKKGFRKSYLQRLFTPKGSYSNYS